MRVLIVNTSEKTGGAAIAANRLMETLNNNGVKAKMLVRDKETEKITVVALPKSKMHRLRFIWERFVIWKANHFKKHNLFYVDIANAGTDITSLPEFKEADIIHLHWINQGLLSLGSIRKIIATGKPIVWTMHDMWPFTGICHHSDDCEKFQQECHHCPLLYQGSAHDLSYRVFQKKKRLFRNAHITFVACSQWLANRAKQSTLLTGQKIVAIPNAVNSSIFRPEDKENARLQFNLPADKQLILFGSMKTTDKRKGIDYLIEACRILKEQYADATANLGIVIVGKEAESLRHSFPFPTYAIDYVADEKRMATLYNAVDAFVTPSLQENLPNTIAEAMACGTPCVGFHIGGIPEMIDHMENGYVATYRDAGDFSHGIVHILTNSECKEMSQAAIRKASLAYSERNVAMKYINIYNQSTDRARA